MINLVEIPYKARLFIFVYFLILIKITVRQSSFLAITTEMNKIQRLIQEEKKREKDLYKKMFKAWQVWEGYLIVFN